MKQFLYTAFGEVNDCNQRRNKVYIESIHRSIMSHCGSMQTMYEQYYNVKGLIICNVGKQGGK